MEEWLNSVKLIKQINDEIVKQGNKAMRTHDMTMTQLDALIEIDTFPDRHCSLKNLEQRLHLAQPTVVGIISRLEQKGYVETFGDPDGKRVKLVCITDEGTACAEISKQARREAVIRLLSCLTSRGAEHPLCIAKKSTRFSITSIPPIQRRYIYPQVNSKQLNVDMIRGTL